MNPASRPQKRWLCFPAIAFAFFPEPPLLIPLIPARGKA